MVLGVERSAADTKDGLGDACVMHERQMMEKL
jgi:hypothetical protein